VKQGPGVDDVLMPSTPLAYLQVVSRCLASFRVVDSTVSAGRADFWAWFDSRQLHTEDAGQGPKALVSFLLVKIPVKSCNGITTSAVDSGVWFVKDGVNTRLEGRDIDRSDYKRGCVDAARSALGR
jgi:hypothetical protein